MKITTGQAIRAYEAVIRLAAISLPYGERRKLKALRDALKAEVDFYIECERELVEQYADQDEKGRPKVKGGSFKISDPAQRAEYLARAAELQALEIKIIPSGVVIGGDILVSLADEEALEGLVEFAGGD